MARIYHDAFARLGRRRQVRFYLWNPSREHWDDIRAQWQHPGEGDDPFHLEDTGHLALQRWGRPGREHIREVLQLADTDRLRTDWSAPEPSTLLQHLQHSIITLGTGDAPPPPPWPDPSLRIHACTGPRREAEVVADAVWQTILDAEGALRFSDLAVVLPDAAKADYLDHLRVAFAGARAIPWELADEAPGLLRETVEAAKLLLGLARTELSRADVVCALTHPAVRRRWARLPLENLPEFCDRAGIVIRFGAADTVGTDQEGGLWTWERGLRRTALGHFMGAPEPAAAPAADLASDPPPALPVEDAPDMSLFLGALLQDLRHLNGRTLSPREWVPALRAFLQAYLGHPDGAPGVEDEQEALAQVMKALARLADLEFPGLAAPRLAFREALVLAEAALDTLAAESLTRLGRGVVVATHASLRGVPFHTRFLMGLGEGAFPRAAVRDPMDLTAGKRKPGDLGPAEQDRYLFLEALMSARQALVLSYVCRDPLTREELQPSSLILDLRDLLLPALGPGGWNALTIRHPQHRHDLAYFPDLGGAGALPPSHAPAARAEAEALLLGNSLRAAAGVVDLPADRGRWRLDPGARAGLDAWAGPQETEAAPPPPDRLRISASRLRKWLECQIQGGALLRLGLREEEDDLADLAEEPLAGDPRDLGALRQAALWEALARGLDAAAAVDRLHRIQVEAARMPPGLLFQGSRDGLLRAVDGWLRLLPAGAAPVRHRFGGDASGRPSPLPVRAHEPITLDLVLDGRPVLVQLEGSTEPLLDGWSLLPSTHPPPTLRRGMDPRDRLRLLRAWVDHLMLAAAGQGPHQGALVLGAPGDGPPAAWTAAPPAVSRDEARDQLGQWVTAACTERRWTLLPLEAVLECLDTSTEDLAPWIEKALDSDRAGFSSTRGPLPRAAWREDAEAEPDWRAIAARRLGSFPEWSRCWKEAP
jgi:exodeoxyribonuclease V gamma subunit